MTRRAAVIECSSASSDGRAPRQWANRNPRPLNAITFKRALALAQEAAFLWTSRSTVVRSSAVTFDVLAGLDERLSRIVHKLSERPILAERFLQHDGGVFASGLMFVTVVVAIRGGSTTVFDELLTRLDSDSQLLSPLASALSWLEYDEVRPYVGRLLAAGSPARLKLGLVTATAHRVHPGVATDRALEAEAPGLRATALETIGRLALGDFRPKLRPALQDDDPACRFWAAWGVVRLGDRAGIPVLGRFVAERGPFAKPACDIALRALEPDHALRAQKRLLSIAGNERLGVLAAGIVGDPRLASWLLDAMEAPPVAREAGAAFCLMTGRDLRRDDLDAGRPPAAVPLEALRTEGDEAQALPDSIVDFQADDDLAWPDVIRLRRWWNENGLSFVPGIRYLAGRPIRAGELASVLRSGNQQQRAAAALELALLNSDAPLLDVTAPAHRQIGASNQLL